MRPSWWRIQTSPECSSGLDSFVLKDEIYQVKDCSREKVRVLMRLDASKLDLKNPHVHRKDLDFAVTWAKMYGKGRVFYSTLGHVEQNWDDPRMQKMYVEAIKWAMGLVNADVTPRPLPSSIRKDRERAAQYLFRRGRAGIAIAKVSLRCDRRKNSARILETEVGLYCLYQLEFCVGCNAAKTWDLGI